DVYKETDLTPLSAWFWGCCAAQRRTSLLATGNLRLTERHWDKPARHRGLRLMSDSVVLSLHFV
ncbi:hypothetical protein, partial [Pseudomonas poae]|uniref:hypothetical protein n=1 Tax=Pseudomonas poae TaxID=200451 RepID=UPI001F39BF3A